MQLRALGWNARTRQKKGVCGGWTRHDGEGQEGRSVIIHAQLMGMAAGVTIWTSAPCRRSRPKGCMQASHSTSMLDMSAQRYTNIRAHRPHALRAPFKYAWHARWKASAKKAGHAPLRLPQLARPAPRCRAPAPPPTTEGLRDYETTTRHE